MRMLFLLLSLSAFATETQLSALGQPSGGSFYLKDNRNFLRNPATLSGYSQVSYDVNARDLIYNEEQFVLAGGKLESGSSSVLGAYKFTDTLGASLRTSVQDGTFFDDITIAFGMEMERVEAYIRANEVDNGEDSFTGGLVLPMDAYTLFAEYTDMTDSSKYGLLVGLSKVFAKTGVVAPFADFTYTRSNGSNQGLALTAGMMADAYTDITLYASLKHNFVFSKKSTLNAGLDYDIAKNLVLGGALSVSPFTKDEVKYKDVDAKLSLSYLL